MTDATENRAMHPIVSDMIATAHRADLDRTAASRRRLQDPRTPAADGSRKAGLRRWAAQRLRALAARVDTTPRVEARPAGR